LVFLSCFPHHLAFFFLRTIFICSRWFLFFRAPLFSKLAISCSFLPPFESSPCDHHPPRTETESRASPPPPPILYSLCSSFSLSSGPSLTCSYSGALLFLTLRLPFFLWPCIPLGPPDLFFGFDMLKELTTLFSFTDLV